MTLPHDASPSAEVSYRELVESASDVIYTHDLQGHFTSVNAAVTRVLGWSPEEFLRQDLVSVIAPDFLDKTREVLTGRLTDRLQPFRLVAVAKDGRRVPLEVSVRLFQRDGRIAGVMGIARDVSEREASAARLRASEDRFRHLVEQSLAGIYIVEAWHWAYVNPKLAEIFGYAPQELIGLPVEQLVHEPDRAKVRESLRRRLEGGAGTLHYTFRARRKDGAVIDVEVHDSRTEVDGRPAVIGTLLDVTERKRAEAAVRESEERYALAAAGANDGLWDWDLRTGTIYLSARWLAQIGVTQGELTNDPNAWIGRVHADDRSRLLADIGLHLEGRTPHLEVEHRIRHEDGSWRWMLVRGLAVRNGEGKAYRMAGSQTDITQRKQSEEKLLHDALHDGLTGLPNRSLFMDRLGQAMAFQRRRADYQYAVLFCDLDRFKTINDSLGHFQGDQLLVAVARQLVRCVKPGDTVSRLGGDEFCILLEDFLDPDEPLRVVDRIHQELSRAHDLDGTEVFASVSIGIARGHPGYLRPGEILRDADTAMYRAKEQGRARSAVFQPSMHARARAILQMETDLRRALERGELALTYQPVVSLTTGGIAGAEALCTWRHPVRGRIPPAEFIPVAEETGLIVPIGAWVLREAARACKAWNDKLPSHQRLSVAVNLSARQLQPELLDHVKVALQHSGLEARHLRLEVTESVIMEHAGPATLLLGQLKNLNVHLLLDDFGTGYSSLGYLHNFRFDALKIDRSFTSRAESGKPAEIVRTIISLAQTLGMEVVAEGVETLPQVQVLQALRCEFAQGFYFSRAIDHETFEQLLRSRQPWSLPPASRPPSHR